MIMKSPKVKYALIPLLAAILGYVLIREEREESDNAESISANNTQKLNVAAKIAQVEWPVFQAEEIAMLQPFQTVKQLEPSGGLDGEIGSESASDEALADDLASGPTKVLAIFQTPNGAAALLGNRVVRVGDMLEDGRRVTVIHAQGIEVSDQ